MESITIFPKNEKQKSLLKALLEEMKIKFEVTSNDESSIKTTDFLKKIDKAILQVKQGKTVTLSKNNQKDFLGL